LYLFGSLASGGYLGDLKGAGVGGDNAVRGNDSLHFLDNLVLDAQVFEYSLDHYIHILELVIV
jgi:hypothetical protein